MNRTPFRKLYTNGVRTQPPLPAGIVLPRIPPHKTPIGELAVWLLIQWSVRGMFARVRLREAAGDPRAASVPLLGVANHPSWWDGYLAMIVARQYGLPRYLMMDAPQLARYRFFAWAGCFSVDRADPREVARSVAFAAHLLATERQSLVWLFPQAEITPADARPLVMHGGAAHVLRRASATGRDVGFLPVAWQYAFRGEQHPEAFIRLGAVEVLDATTARDTRSVTARIQSALTAQADALRDDIAADDLTAYRVVLHGKSGVNDAFDRLLGRSRLVDTP